MMSLLASTIVISSIAASGALPSVASSSVYMPSPTVLAVLTLVGDNVGGLGSSTLPCLDGLETTFFFARGTSGLGVCIDLVQCRDPV